MWMTTQSAAMSGSTEIFTFAAAALVVASASLTGFGMRQRRYVGWHWWVLAIWLATLGATLGATPDTLWPAPIGAGLSLLLLMQWPVVTLIGLRRFHPRQALPGSERMDWAVLVTASLLAAGAAIAGPQGTWLALGCSVTAHLYAAALLFMGPAEREFTPAKFLGVTMVSVAIAPVALAWPDTGLQTTLPAMAAAAALGAVVLAMVAVTLVCERAELQLRDSRRRLHTLASLDTLTRVPTRHHFQDLADQALLQDEPGSAVLLNFDVDRLKQINDLFGRAAGDRALRLVSRAMLEQLRAQDVPGRHGGDEFMLLLRRTTTQDALGVAARIVSEVQRRAPDQQLPTLTLSFGLVQVGLGESVRAAMRRADQAMYEAKRQGRSHAVTAAGDEDKPVFEQSQRLGLMPA